MNSHANTRKKDTQTQTRKMIKERKKQRQHQSQCIPQYADTPRKILSHHIFILFFFNVFYVIPEIYDIISIKSCKLVKSACPNSKNWRRSRLLKFGSLLLCFGGSNQLPTFVDLGFFRSLQIATNNSNRSSGASWSINRIRLSAKCLFRNNVGTILARWYSPHSKLVPPKNYSRDR